MKKTFAVCNCRLECEQIELADGTSLLLCVGCETYAERADHRGRLVRFEDGPLTPKRRRARAA
jgi:hypothetical protein